MSNKVKDIDIKNQTYYFFNGIININNFDPSNMKTDENSYKNILIYYIGYKTIKDLKYVKTYSVNPLYLIDDRKILVVSTYIFRCNFSSWNIHGVSTFFDVILMVKKSTLFALTFLRKFWWAKILRRFW